MLYPPASCGSSLLSLLAGIVLTGAVVSTDTAAAFQPSADLSGALANWMRDYTPSQFRQLEVARGPIDPADFSEFLLAAAIFQETNQQRLDLGLSVFSPDERASAAAHTHARWMANTHRLSHDEPSGRGTMRTAYDRLVQQGLRPHLAAENIADNFLLNITPGRIFYTRLVEGHPVYSYRPGGPSLSAHSYEDFARVILAQWMHSPPHRAHIISPDFRFLGVGVAIARRQGHPDTIYVTQDFFTPHVFSSNSAADPLGATALLPRP